MAKRWFAVGAVASLLGAGLVCPVGQAQAAGVVRAAPPVRAAVMARVPTVETAAMPVSVPRAVGAPSWVKVKKKSTTSLKVWWAKVPGAKSYKVYRLVKGKWKVVKTTSSLSWVNKKLPKRKLQQYRVVACPQTKGKGACGPMSVAVSGVTYSSRDKKVNVGALTLREVPKSLGVHDEWSFSATLKPSASGKGKRPVSKAVRFASSNPTVVSVTRPRWQYDGDLVEEGRLVVKKLGSAKITVIAHNGVSKSFWVTVKNEECPIKLEREAPSSRHEAVTSLIAGHKDQLCALARYSMSYPIRGTELSLNDQGRLVSRDGPLDLPAPVVAVVEDILAFDWPYPVSVTLVSGAFTVVMELNGIASWPDLYSSQVMLGYGAYRHELNTWIPTTHWGTNLVTNEPLT